MAIANQLIMTGVVAVIEDEASVFNGETTPVFIH
jgi:hypothetical protein